MIRRTAKFFVVALILIGGVGFFTLKWLGDSISPRESTDVHIYNAALKAWHSPELIKHFPQSIPAYAKNVHFSSLPGSLQGGTHLQLRMQLPPEQIADIETQLKKAASHIYIGGGWPDRHKDDPKGDVPTTTFHTADDPVKTQKFPNDYTLYVLSAKVGDEMWDHFDTAGVAVSIKMNEVIYWAES